VSLIPVTRAFLPPLEAYQAQVKRAFDNCWLTNRGELVQELEQRLMATLDVSQILLMTNGTIPLQIALKLLGKGGEVITTPFSYVATTSSIVWEGCTPVFVDIDPEHLTIDETAIEAAITPRTTAILATHVFGNPCHVEAIASIAAKHGLSVIYDAAHAFGVRFGGKSIFDFGHVSTCSFHATKLFHTGEGGATFCNDPELAHRIYYSHNFGHDGPLAFHGLGINGKMSELQAAMGLAVLPHVNDIVTDRKRVTALYDTLLADAPLQHMRLREGTQWNHSYYPVLFPSEAHLLRVLGVLLKEGVQPRRYFYPALSNLPYVTTAPMRVAEDVASRIACLPMYHGLAKDDVERICAIIREHLTP
jgi:dTDP-4-amino-4,6-dideoxygalactose transaminase